MGYDRNSAEDKTTAFNMGLATLERINNLIISLSSYHIENNVPGMRNTILELYKESHVYMNQKQKDEAEAIWSNIDNYNIESVDSTSIKYDPKILEYINYFDFWLREILHKKGILMPKGEDPHTAMTKSGY